jgi:hypothetical protein
VLLLLFASHALRIHPPTYILIRDLTDFEGCDGYKDTSVFVTICSSRLLSPTYCASWLLAMPLEQIKRRCIWWSRHVSTQVEWERTRGQALRPTGMPESSEYTKILCLRTRPTYAFFSGLPYWG